MGEKRRSVVESDLFADCLAALVPFCEDADEFIAGAQDVLSRDPEIGSRVPGAPGVWSLPLSTIADLEATLFYTFDEESVLFLAVVTFGGVS